MKHKSKNHNGSFEWTPKKMILWGFNIIAGYTFIVSLSSVFGGVGNWLPILFLISGLIAFGSGLSFGKLSEKYNKNGGTLLYTRNVLGKNASGFFGFYQALQMPMLTASIPITTVWLFTGMTLHGHSFGKEWYTYLGAFIILVIACSIPFFGFTSSNVTLYILWSLKWILTFMMFALALIEIKSFGSNIFHNGFNPLATQYVSNNNIGPYEAIKTIGFARFAQLIGSLVTLFFAFGGFEAVAAQSSDIKNSKNEIISILLTIIVGVCIFYLFFYFFFLGALGASNPSLQKASLRPIGGNDYNPLNALIATVFSNKNIDKILVGVGGTIVFIIGASSQILNKATSRIQCGWGNAKIIAAYSEVGFLPKEIKYRNNKGKRTFALLLDISICIFFAFIFLILSFFGQYLVTGVLDIISYISFMQYGIVSFCAIVLHFRKSDSFKLKLWQLYYFIFVSISILFFLVSYTFLGVIDFVSFINIPIKYRTSADLHSLTVMIDVIMIFLLFILAFGLIFLSKIFGWSKNASDDENNFSDNVDKILGHIDINKEGDDFAFKGF